MTRRTLMLLGLLAPLTVSAADSTPAAKPKKQEDPKHKIVFIDAAQAGVDYKLQGEYDDGGAGKWGAQVVALGDGKFHAAIFPGGLPGTGWDAKTRYESEGALDGQTVTLHGVEKVAWSEGHFPPADVVVKKGFDVQISSDQLTATSDTGEKISLKHTLRHSPTEGLKPAAGAIVLFDGSNVDAWKGAKIADEGAFKGAMREGGTTNQKWTDYTLHVEFCLPFKPFARSQERGNSGVYNQNRYETQVLDSFGVMGMDNQCGGIYTKHAPAVNMAFPPLTWQTYDIDFTAARYENGARKSEAVITVKHNGVLVHDQYKIDGPTGGGQKEVPTEAVQSGPLYLQNHGNPVFYRNVWIVEKK